MDSKLIDETNGKLEEIKIFASTHPNGISLDNCFKSLERMCGDKEDKIVKIYPDWAHMSLGFGLFDTKQQKFGVVGGIIYHGTIDGKQVKNLSVSIELTNGWQIHT